MAHQGLLIRIISLSQFFHQSAKGEGYGIKRQTELRLEVRVQLLSFFVSNFIFLILTRIIIRNKSTVMDQQQQQPPPPPPPPAPKPVPFTYIIQTLLKGAFLVMSIVNLKYTLVVAFAASLIGLLRVLKTPQFNKQYLARALTNNHGQNLLYISVGSLGFVNYLFYAPIALFFAYNIVEFIKIKFPANSFNAYGDVIRYNKYYVYEGKCKIELAFLAYCVVTIPFDFMGRAIKIFILAQFFMVKYRLNNEFRYACTNINTFIEDKTKSIGFLHNGYKKAAGWLYEYANRDPRASQGQQAQQ